MRIVDKLRVYLAAMPYEHTEAVDDILQFLMDNGEIISRDEFWLTVRVGGKDHRVWWTPYCETNLSEIQLPGGILYDYLSPSRRMIIKFMEWVEQHDEHLLYVYQVYRAYKDGKRIRSYMNDFTSAAS